MENYKIILTAKLIKKYRPFKRVARAPRTKAQGRPMGSHIAWLDIPCVGDAASHRAEFNRLSYEVRRKARRDAVNSGLYADLFALERDPHASESDGEPHHVPTINE